MERTPLWWLRGALVAVTWAAYYPVWQNDFVDYDDDPFITRNAHIHNGLTADGIQWAVLNAEPPYRAPLTWLTLQLDSEVSARIAPEGPRPRPEVVHAQNLVWHSVNVLLLFGLCRGLPGGTNGRAFLVAGLFALHPMHVESVAWGIERKDVLMCTFGIVSVRAYLRFAATRRWVFYAGAWGAMALSLAAKPMLMTLPFVFLLLDIWPLNRVLLAPGCLPTRAQLGLLGEKVPFFALALAAAQLTLQTHGGSSFIDITFVDRFMNALSGYAWYVLTTLWPAPLCVLYPHPRGNWSGAAALTGAGLLVAVTALALWHARRRPWLLVGWCWFLGTLFPLIGFAQGGRQAWADRFSYWPHIGFFIALVWGAAELAPRLRVSAPLARALGAGALAGLAVWTSIQVTYWRDGVTLWELALAVTERNEYAHERLSVCYRRLGRTADADAHAATAVRAICARHFGTQTGD